MKRNNYLYLIIGILVAAVVGFSVYTYQEEKKPEGVQLSIGENGVKIEAN
jgi:hypothetical protein